MLVITRGYVQSERRDMALSWSPKTNLETACVSEPEIGHPNIKGVHCYRGPDRCPSGVFRKRQKTPATARDILQRQRCCFFPSSVLQIQPQIYPNYWSGISKPVGWFPYKMRSPRIAVVQALVFLTVQQWHMMRVHHSRIAGWLMKIPGFRLHSPRENPWRFDKPSPDPDHRTATRWRHLETPPYTLGGSSMRHGVDVTHQDSGRCRHGVHFHHCSLVVPLDV